MVYIKVNKQIGSGDSDSRYRGATLQIKKSFEKTKIKNK